MNRTLCSLLPSDSGSIHSKTAIIRKEQRTNNYIEDFPALTQFRNVATVTLDVFLPCRLSTNRRIEDIGTSIVLSDVFRLQILTLMLIVLKLLFCNKSSNVPTVCQMVHVLTYISSPVRNSCNIRNRHKIRSASVHDCAPLLSDQK